MTCEDCGGTGFVVVPRDGREYADPCSCRRRGARGTATVGECRIPPMFEECSLSNFEPRTPSLSLALEQSMRYCSGFPFLGPDEGLGLLYTGGPGVGKSHLAVAVLRELATSKGVRGQFWDFNELLREIRRSYDARTETTEHELLDPLINMDLLVLDDLGAQKLTDWVNDTLHFIVNSRYLAKRPTVVTTNYEDADPETARRADPLRRTEYLVERVGYRIRSRLLGMCAVVRMQAPDWRTTRKGLQDGPLPEVRPLARRGPN